jgi:hypothetical protein
MSDDLIKAGLEASRLVAELRARRRQLKSNSSYRPGFRDKGTRLPDDWLLDPRNLWTNGYWRYMLDREERVIGEARRQIAEERPYWRQHFMTMVESHLEDETDPDVVAGLKRELRKVRRALGLLTPTQETIREQTRARVRRHRAKRKTKVTM